MNKQHSQYSEQLPEDQYYQDQFSQYYPDQESEYQQFSQESQQSQQFPQESVEKTKLNRMIDETDNTPIMGGGGAGGSTIIQQSPQPIIIIPNQGMGGMGGIGGGMGGIEQLLLYKHQEKLYEPFIDMLTEMINPKKKSSFGKKNRKHRKKNIKKSRKKN